MQKAHSGFHSAGLERFLFGLLALALQVVEVGPAEPATDAVLPLRITDRTNQLPSVSVLHEPTGESPGPAGVLNLQDEFVAPFLKVTGTRSLSATAPADGLPMLVHELPIEPDFDTIVGADAEHGLLLLGHIHLGPGVRDHVPSV